LSFDDDQYGKHALPGGGMDPAGSLMGIVNPYRIEQG